MSHDYEYYINLFRSSDKNVLPSNNFFPSVQSTTVSMSQSPSGQVAEDTDVTLTCVTDEAKPDASIVWLVGGKSVKTSSDSVEAGIYDANITRSQITLPVNRTLNGKEVECVAVEAGLHDKIVLDVVCKYHFYILFNLPKHT